MKKVVVIIAFILLLISGLAYFVIPQYALNLVKDYDPYTFERVLEDDTMRVNYGIYENNSPIDYGFNQFEEVAYPSILDKNKLSSWYIPASKTSNKTILLIHGRWSNRLKTMKYLELFKAYGLDSLYNIMIPDLRNSGKSEKATTMMGYEFAEDIASTMLWLSKNKQQINILPYGFSMGAMAVATLLNRKELMDVLSNSNLVISKIILDSPVANVQKILTRGGTRTGIPTFILDRTMKLLNDEYNQFPSTMKFRTLFNDTKYLVLILQGTNDQSQPVDLLKEELQILKSSNIKLELFEEAEHVKIYQSSNHKMRYSQLVHAFIENR